MSESPSTDLVRRAHGLAKRSGAARSTSEVAFDTTPLTWRDVPAEQRRVATHPSPVVADAAVTDGVLYEDREGLVQVMRAWRAHRERLFVAVALRGVAVVGDELRVLGGWEPLVLRRYDVAGEPRRRIGWVPAGARPSSPASATTPGSHREPAPDQPRHHPAHDAAVRAWPYLPEPVRAGAQRAVPVPEDWIGELVQQHQLIGRMPTSHEITVLRRDAETAVVIRATRELAPVRGVGAADQAAALAAADWLVEQVVLTTAQPKRLEATREMPPWM